MQTALQSRDSDAASRPPPADIGDESWSKMLAKCPSWSPEGEALLVVAPHPNDETLGAGGLIRTWAALGRQVNVLSVSDGEAAEPRLEGLGNVRREEMREALRKLCPTHVSVTRLGLPDGRIAEHLNRLRNAMLSLCRDKVTLIAPYEHDGHPDNEGVGALCIDFARARNIPIARYIVHSRFVPGSEAAGKERWVKFSLSDEARRAKYRALQCFRSQIEIGPDQERAYEVFALGERGAPPIESTVR
jgi:LmbE family N-acetylglucosaminyl deacetylase